MSKDISKNEINSRIVTRGSETSWPSFDQGIISLDPIYDFIRKHPEIPGPAAKDAEYRLYREVVHQTLNGVPTTAGWYCWYQDTKKPQAIYIGQASKGRTASLHARLDKELESERVAFWATVYGKEAVIEAITTQYLQAGHKDYRANQMRSARKQGATKILWVSFPAASGGVLDVVEHKLIQEFAPPANATARNYSEIETSVYTDVLEAFQRVMGLA